MQAKRGRKRKENVRRSKVTGRILDRQTEEQRMAVVLAQPHRRWAANPRDERLGYPLGRLQYSGYITREQLDAGDWWAGVVRSYAGMMGIRVENPRGIMGSMVGSFSGGYQWEGQDAGDDDDARKRREAISGRYDNCYQVLVDLGQVHRVGHRILKVCRRICIGEENEITLWPNNIGLLRLGLNALDRVRSKVK